MKKKILIIILILTALFYLSVFAMLFYTTFALRNRLNSLPASLAAKDWQTAAELLNDSADKLKNGKLFLYLTFPFNKLPIVNEEIKNIYLLVDSGLILTNVGQDFLGWLVANDALSKIDIFSFPTLAQAEKETVLSSFSQTSGLWQKHQDKIRQAASALVLAARQSRLPYLKNRINAAQALISDILALLSDIQPWLENAPDLLGYPQEKTYLLLLQNNTELRPTGGFIGTFGVLKAASGEIKEFYTENVYNLDEPAKQFNTKTPPLPLQKYIKQKQWFFRDSNWDPDFAGSAQAAIKFYQDEKGKEKKFDGVFAFTPELIKEFLRLTGAVEIEGTVFNAENIVDKLQYEVALGFVENGVSIYNRKRIIDDLAQVLKQRIYNLNAAEYKTFLSAFLKLLREKHLLLNFSNANLQKLAEENNWAGRIMPAAGDYIYVVDANLGSLKTDPAVEHILHYQIKPGADGRLQSELAITYKNTGKFDWKTTRYRTYVRVYLPLGAQLVKSDGNEEKVAIGQERGKTVFGTFISIEPGQEETLRYRYYLPDNLRQSLSDGHYELYLQKQPGTAGHKVRLDLELPYQVARLESSDALRLQDEHIIAGQFNLAIDKKIEASIE